MAATGRKNFYVGYRKPKIRVGPAKQIYTEIRTGNRVFNLGPTRK